MKRVAMIKKLYDDLDKWFTPSSVDIDIILNIIEENIKIEWCCDFDLGKWYDTKNGEIMLLQDNSKYFAVSKNGKVCTFDYKSLDELVSYFIEHKGLNLGSIEEYSG